MPSLGADMDDGKLVEWLKKPGDELRRGDIIAVVETQKGAIEIEVFHDGVLEETVAKPGTTLPVGALLAIIRTPGEPAPANASSSPPAEPVHPVSPIPVAPVSPVHLTHGLKASPAARQEAKNRGIDIGLLKPGPDGIIGLRELAEVASAAAPVPARRGIDLDEMRKAIGAAMARSKREIPHYYVTSAIDVSGMMNWLSQENAARPVASRLLPLVPIIKACAQALSKVKELNGRYVEDRFFPSSSVKMGVGIALRGGGLIAPAIDRVESLGLDEIMARLSDLTSRTRGGRLRSSELTEASVTLSSLGENSADTLLPIIYPPQVAIIGVGRIEDRPWSVEGGIGLRKIASFTVAGDHRVSDGRSAARFLQIVQSFLDKPEDS